MSGESVELIELHDVWFHTGTACNLECPFCLEGSKPGDTRLERITLPEVKPYIDEAVSLNVRRFAFTGGEPLIVKDIVKILGYALERKPCLVLTNGTAPLIKRAHQLQTLKAYANPLSFRISIDHPDEARHDKERGWGNFKRAIEGLKLLHQAGFDVSIARHSSPDENAASVNATYRELLGKAGIPPLPIVPLPELGRPGLGVGSFQTRFQTQGDLSSMALTPMCATSRMILKREGRLSVHSCPLTDDDARFDYGPSLKASLSKSTPLVHSRCGQCMRFGVALG